MTSSGRWGFTCNQPRLRHAASLGQWVGVKPPLLSNQTGGSRKPLAWTPASDRRGASRTSPKRQAGGRQPRSTHKLGEAAARHCQPRRLPYTGLSTGTDTLRPPSPAGTSQYPSSQSGAAGVASDRVSRGSASAENVCYSLRRFTPRFSSSGQRQQHSARREPVDLQVPAPASMDTVARLYPAIP